MAGNAEDVLELDPNDILDSEDETEDQADTGDEQPEEGDEGQPYIGFEGEEAAPASESESSVIRELRARNRDMAARLKQQETGQAPQPIEVGDEPTFEASDYDEDKFKADWTAWQNRKAKAEQQQAEQRERAEKEREAETKLLDAYEADQERIGFDDFSEREAEVIAALPRDYDKLLLRSGKAAELIVALSNSPAKLSELSKLDPLNAAMMVGELRSKLHMGTRKAPQPDRPVRGNAAPASADKQLERLEKEAERTGDRTEVIRYKRKLKSKA